MINFDESPGKVLAWAAIKALLGWAVVTLTMVFVSLVIGSVMRDTKTKRIEDTLERLDGRIAVQYQRASEDRLDILARLQRIEKVVGK